MLCAIGSKTSGLCNIECAPHEKVNGTLLLLLAVERWKKVKTDSVPE